MLQKESKDLCLDYFSDEKNREICVGNWDSCLHKTFSSTSGLVLGFHLGRNRTQFVSLECSQ